MIAAVFDVDRTLLPETTAERLFVRYLLQERVLGVRAAVETLRFSLLHGWPNPVREVRRNRPYLRGQLSLAMTEMGARCFEQVIRPRLAASGIERLREHRELGHHTVLLSGSLPFVLQPLAEAVGADETICSRMEERNGRLLGRLVGPHPYGTAKVSLIQRFAHDNAVDLASSYCYADHDSDAGVLQLFGHPICINPNDRLRAIAGRLGWPVEEFC